MIDARLGADAQEDITPGEAVAGMILNGLGCANRPLSLTPQFFAKTPLDLLCREGVRAEMFNRFTLGRTLDKVHTYGGDLLCSDMALAVCAHEGLDLRVNHRDTTRFALTGASGPDSDEQAVTMTHGDSKDHRPDVTQAVLERMVSHDGGVPCVSQSWDGHAADTPMFQERAEALITTLQRSSTPRSLVADAKRYHAANAASLSQLSCITRMPHTLTRVAQAITQALTWDRWPSLDATTHSHRLEFCHDGLAQRWLVVSSAAALERAEASVSKAQQRACAAIDKQLFHLQAQRVETPEAAPAAGAALAKRWTSHQVEASSLIEHTHDAHHGRPTPTTPIHSIDWQMPAQVRPDQAKLAYDKPHNACVVVGTTIEAAPLSDPEVIQAYTGQAQVEGGCRFLKDPRFFVSSLLVKQPCRMQGLLMVMT